MWLVQGCIATVTSQVFKSCFGQSLVSAVDNLSLTVNKNQILSLLGEKLDSAVSA